MHTQTEVRQIKAEQICSIPNSVSKVNETEYIVKSQSGIGEYHVSKTLSGFVCDCKDYLYRGYSLNGSRSCKHTISVSIQFQLNQEVSKRTTILEPIIVTECQFCHSKALKKFGIRRNKSGDIQRYLCEYCKRTFSVNIGFERMRHNPQAITTALQCYFSGESLRATQSTLRLLGVNVCHRTVFLWIRKYCTLLQKYADRIKPQVSDEWRADEMYFKIKKNLKYVFILADDETRYRIAQEVAHTKQDHNATELFQKGKEIAGKTPIRLTTDGLGSYANAYDSVFKNPARETEHIREIALDGVVHNNRMERHVETLRGREKTMRSFKKMDSPILAGTQIFYNFIRPHMALNGKTPAEKAGIEVRGKNKWKTLIENATVMEGKHSVREKLERLI